MRGGRKRKVAKVASWRLGTWIVKAAAEKLRARRRVSTNARLPRSFLLRLHLLPLHLNMHLGLHMG